MDENIHFDHELSALKQYLSENKEQKFFILVDSNTKQHCLPIVLEKLQPTSDPVIIEVAPGDTNKSEQSLFSIFEVLSQNKASKSSILINLGGGVVTDLGGFASSAFKRGMRNIHIPTTLLGMIDASIGGKNGINFRNIKNLIGSIRKPEAVFISSLFLNTLSERELKSGLAEAFKHGLIASKSYWESLSNEDMTPWDRVIEESIQIKSSIVDKDLYESGLRKVLNAGHTIGHAIESTLLSQGSDTLHGEAVAAGLIIESKISSLKELLDNSQLNEIISVLNKSFPKVPIVKSDVNTIIDFIKQDKKNVSEQTNSFTLLDGIGSAITDQTVTEEELLTAINFYLEL